MILLNLHPDVVGGKHHVLALMFDMNMLWERFVFKSLVKFKPQSYFVTAKSRKHFWRSKGSPTTIIPDIFIDTKDGEHVVLDTKWKNIGGEAPSVHDLRQMYAYSKFYNNAKTALVYPGLNFGLLAGNFLDEISDQKLSSVCGVMTLRISNNINIWQKEIADYIFKSDLFIAKDQVATE